VLDCSKVYVREVAASTRLRGAAMMGRR
jgi:hypothetical protein